MLRVRRSASLVPSVVVLAALVLAGCGSDGITRPTLPNRTTTVAGSTPATDPAVTDSPTTDAPVTEPTTVPATDPAATPAPTTVPATQPPATQPPATEAPTTLPATDAPTTAPATTPASSEPGTTTETTGPAVTEPGTEGDDGTTWWPWVLAAALLALIIGALVARGRRPSWDDRLRVTLDRIDGVTRRLASPVPGQPGTMEADAATLAEVRAELSSLVSRAPDERRSATLVALAQPLADLHLAVGAAALTAGPATPPPGAPLPPPGATPAPAPSPELAQLAAVVHTTAATVRASLLPAPPAA